MHRTSKLLFTALFIQLSLNACSSSQSDSATLNALIESDWEWTMETYPTYATYLGDKRYNDRLQDLSPEAIEANKRYAVEMLAKLNKIDESALEGQDKLNFALFKDNFETEVAGQAFPSDYMPVNQMGGVQIDLPGLFSYSPFDDVIDYENYIARMNAMPLFIEQTVALMTKGVETGWVYPRGPLESLPSQIEARVNDTPDASPFLRPFASFPDGISEEDGVRLKAEATMALTDAVIPAYAAMLDFVNNVYMPATPTDIGASGLPDGEAYYEYRVQRMTTTKMTAQEIHDKGLSEVARIRGEMLVSAAEAGFPDDLPGFQNFLNEDPQFFQDTGQERVDGYIAINDHLYKGLATQFGTLPVAKVTVEAMPDYEAPTGPGAYYRGPTADGSRPGTFYANTSNMHTRPNYEMESLTMHEAVPGHHLQIAIAKELQGLPEFRKNGGYGAYVEGWALYAESLGEDLGVYANPYSKYGQLSSEMFRAVRLVVDTGMHFKHWSAQDARDYFEDVYGKLTPEHISEVNRYIVWPGQALGYKVGQLKIMELRAKAEKELGSRFDIREFHDAVLEQGALPLSTLEDQINSWIEAVGSDT